MARVQELDYRRISRRLSAERFAPYRLAADGRRRSAIRLYEWNSEMSAAWWTVITDVEVLLRNAMNERLVAWSDHNYGDPRWYLDHGAIFSEEHRRSIESARMLAVRDGRPESTGQVVTELSLGFWRFLLAARYERSLWRTCLYKAWPGEGRRHVVHDAVYRLHGLRNRIAHHEPIHNRPLGDLHGVALKTAKWVCGDTSRWIEGRSRVVELLGVRP